MCFSHLLGLFSTACNNFHLMETSPLSLTGKTAELILYHDSIKRQITASLHYHYQMTNWIKIFLTWREYLSWNRQKNLSLLSVLMGMNWQRKDAEERAGKVSNTTLFVWRKRRTPSSKMRFPKLSAWGCWIKPENYTKKHSSLLWSFQTAKPGLKFCTQS